MLADNTKSGEIAYGIIAAVIWLAYVVAAVLGERRRRRALRDAPPKYTEMESPTIRTGPTPWDRHMDQVRRTPMEYYGQADGRPKPFLGT